MSPADLNEWRLARGLTITQAAAELCVTRQAWYTWIRRGKVPPLVVKYVKGTQRKRRSKDA